MQNSPLHRTSPPNSKTPLSTSMRNLYRDSQPIDKLQPVQHSMDAWLKYKENQMERGLKRRKSPIRGRRTLYV
uniref:LD18978p n=1 Tax=Drosophila melanogaster TaxID=7227 RepID=Q86MR1_DROME|nr:LD18978p [Drosophila melanogaster]